MLRKLVAVAALALVAPVGGPDFAQAQGLNSITIIDEQGDMWRIPEERGLPVAAPNQTRGDIRRTTIRHGEHALTVRMTFSELSRWPQFHDTTVRLRTSAGVRREVNLVAGRSFWRGSVEVDRPSGRPMNCATAHHINYATNVMRLRVPRSCFGEPRWVQANVLSLGVYGRPARAASFFDTAHSRQFRRNDWSPRLHRPEAAG